VKNNTRIGYPLCILRLYLGVIFTIAVLPKLEAGASYAGRLHGFLANLAMEHSQPFYQHFLQSTVLPNIALFSTLVVAGEVFVAIAMLTGTATRAAGVVTMFLVTNYMFSKGLWWWSPASNDGADFMIALALVIGAAGRAFGVDAWLAKRWPSIPAW
jgi:uncharacterized membrane protein YphA (DoxX/SURF4 family)